VFAHYAFPLHTDAFKQLYVERQKLSLKGEARALDDDAILASAGVRDDGELVVKDLGPQVSWRTVFLTEYVRLSQSSFYFPTSSPPRLSTLTYQLK
jgi:hypothetical protein